MADFKTEERFSVVTAKMGTVIMAAILISFIATSLFFLIFILAGVQISFSIIAFGGAIFVASMISIALIPTEYNLAITNDYQGRPPIQFIILFISSYIMVFLIVPDEFMNQPKASIHIITLLAIPPLALTFAIQKAYHTIFISLIHLIAKFSSKHIWNDEQFKDKLDVKFNEVKRYGGTFSLILISITIQKTDLERMKQTMLFMLFFELLRENIRKTDQLGIIENGGTACIISNNNNLAKATLQASRLVSELKKNSLLEKKLKLFNSEFRHTILEFSGEYADSKELLMRAIENMKKALIVIEA